MRWVGTLVLGAAMTLGVLGVSSALGVQPVFAAGCPAGTSPASEGALQGWIYNPPAYSGGAGSVTFGYGNQTEELSINPNYAPGDNLANVDQNWGGIDNPAPLLWYYSHESTTDLGCWAFPAGVTYSPTVVSQMQQDNFAPSTVGGVNPSGLTGPPPPQIVSQAPGPGSGSSGGSSTGSGSNGSGSSGSGTPPPITPTKPTITSVTPTSAGNGQLVTIIGTGFGATEDAGFVRAGVNAMSVVSWSNTKIVIRPEFSPTATKGGPAPIAVTNAHGQTATYANFSLIVPKVLPPTISVVAIGVSTATAADQIVTITGANFGSAQGQGAVSIATPTGADMQLFVQSWTPKKIVATLHMSKQAMVGHPGTYTLTVTTALNWSVTSRIVLAPPRPTKVRTATSKHVGPDMRPYFLLAVIAVLTVAGWIGLRRRRNKAG